MPTELLLTPAHVITSYSIHYTKLYDEPHFKAWYSNGSIYISGEMDGTGEATVYDINGRKVAIHQLSNSVRNQIDAPTGASSLYLVRISDSKRSEVLKVPVVRNNFV